MMDVDAIRRQPLTPAEREHRFRNGLCLVCGTQGHLKATCPSRRQVASISGNVLGNPPINPDRTTGRPPLRKTTSVINKVDNLLTQLPLFTSTSPSLPEPTMNPICLDSLESLDSLDFLETTEPHESLKTPVKTTHPSTPECRKPSPKEPFRTFAKDDHPQLQSSVEPIIFSVSALLDSGSYESLMDESLASQYCLPLVPLTLRLHCFWQMASPATSPHVQLSTQLLKLQTQEHISDLRIFMSARLAHPYHTGTRLAGRHNPLVDWETQSLTFLSSYCSTHCPARTLPRTKLPRIHSYHQHKLPYQSKHPW
ncbi:hypothetical protein BASA83_012789 [Batrachochytrium salamandrivorans]|nr:hypothetical protein BASA83_012789 [Batrachochytrium salamandrivorans]